MKIRRIQKIYIRIIFFFNCKSLKKIIKTIVIIIPNKDKSYKGLNYSKFEL